MNYQVLIVDDHPLYRLALAGAVAAACPDCEIVEADGVGGLFDALELNRNGALSRALEIMAAAEIQIVNLVIASARPAGATPLEVGSTMSRVTRHRRECKL